ncbi:MAG: hypothetical protein A6F71_06545 [Cycloclasticus sp. symbiont of Poecilosclerida sp. M]|nr:MAG: hypothetical protein A6F71_06545 [Cycloclasticus sp. symbiont of Poecilosclerida sp. M]
MTKKELLERVDIEITTGQLKVGAKRYDLKDVTQVNILQQTPVRDAGKMLFAVGVVACFFGSRWFLAGGVFFILLSLVSLFDTSKKLSVALVTPDGDTTVYASYDSKVINELSRALKKEISI